jgi:ABC-type multidrug transport system fused ATPase/permease subunit
MMRLIEEEFASQTVIFVTHRLHTTGKYDKVVVMDSGNILEVGNPQRLLSNSESTFHKLYHKL